MRLVGAGWRALQLMREFVRQHSPEGVSVWLMAVAAVLTLGSDSHQEPMRLVRAVAGCYQLRFASGSVQTVRLDTTRVTPRQGRGPPGGPWFSLSPDVVRARDPYTTPFWPGWRPLGTDSIQLTRPYESAEQPPGGS